jgi:hypothetical protein
MNLVINKLIMDPEASYTAEEWLEYYATRERERRERDADQARRLAEFERENLERIRRLLPKILAPPKLITQPLEQPSCGVCWLPFCDGERPALDNKCECKTFICLDCTISCAFKCPFCRTQS